VEWIERLPYGVDIDKLKLALDELKKVGPMVFQGSEFGYNNFGGWNLQSRSGKYTDGFQVGIEKCYRKYWKSNTFNYHLAKFLDYSHAFEHKNKTNACVGALSDVVDFLESKGFYPRRMRLTCLKPHSKSIIHRDAPSEKYLARIHIPLITNENCVHWTEHGEAHMPADGSVYMLWVNCMHQIRNDSDEDRYHIICDAYDTQGITQNFKYNGDINVLIEEAKNYRKVIDSIKINIFRKIAYTIGRELYMAKFKLEQKLLESSYKLAGTKYSNSITKEKNVKEKK
jgi:hypothetical protein